MQINKINFYNPYKILQPNNLKRVQNTTFRGLEEDAFVKSKENKPSYVRLPFSADKISNIKKIEDINEIDEEIKIAAEKSVDIGILLKNNLDKKYGKDNYVFVSVGTSPAGVAKTLDIMGQDVRYIPFFGLDDVSYFKLNPENIKKGITPDYQKYLDSIGINADRIKQDKRHYVFCNYSNAGNTETVFKIYLQEFLGLSEEKASFETLDNILQDDTDPDKFFAARTKINEYINRCCSYKSSNYFFGIPNIAYYELEKTNKMASKKKTNKEKDFESALYYYYELKQQYLKKIAEYTKMDESPTKAPFSVDKVHTLKVKNDPPLYENPEYSRIRSIMPELALSSVVVGEWLKNYYDEKYGEGGYVFLSVGRSPAPAAKAMEYMGVDVKYIPISELRDAKVKKTKQIDKYIKKEYIDFLNSIGISKEKIENDKRHYVIADYAKKRRTIENLDFILNSWFGIDKSHYSCESLRDVLNKYEKIAKPEEGQSAVDEYIERFCGKSEAEPYCGVPHLPYKKLDQISELVKKTKTEDEKIFEYLICYYLNEKSLI